MSQIPNAVLSEIIDILDESKNALIWQVGQLVELSVPEQEVKYLGKIVDQEKSDRIKVDIITDKDHPLHGQNFDWPVSLVRKVEDEDILGLKL